MTDLAAGPTVETRELTSAVRTALGTVTDPEYPDISIVDLGLVEQVNVTPDGHATVGLIPTFSSCPALAMIATDVSSAVEVVPGITDTSVIWLSTPVWSVDRTSLTARRQLESSYTVVLRRKDGTLRCPVCGSDQVGDQSMAGPTRCRSVAWCETCRNVVEVMR